MRKNSTHDNISCCEEHKCRDVLLGILRPDMIILEYLIILK